MKTYLVQMDPKEVERIKKLGRVAPISTLLGVYGLQTSARIERITKTFGVISAREEAVAFIGG